MSQIEEYIKNRSAVDEEFRIACEEEDRRLDLQDLIYNLRKQSGLNQTDFAKKVNTSRSTIARIENGTMEPSFSLVSNIVARLGKQLKVEVVS